MKTFIKRLDESDPAIRNSLAWEIADVGEEVPLSALLVSRRQPTPQDIERGIKLAKEHGWLDGCCARVANGEKTMFKFNAAEERYQRDPLFKQLVDVMTMHIRDLQLTGTEIREAAMLATIRHEMMNPRPMIFEHPRIASRAQEILKRDLGIEG